MKISEQGQSAPVVDQQQLDELRVWNLALAGLHLLQAVVVALIADDRSLTVTSTFSAGSQLGTVAPSQALFEVPIGLAVAGFLCLSALNHLLAGVVLRERYERDLRRGINRLRWSEYSVSATWMLLLIGLFVGITDVVALLAIAAASVATMLFGWLQELMNPPERTRTTMLPFAFGIIVALGPFAAILLSLAATPAVPGFVVGIVAVQAVLFAAFPANQWLQYAGVGMWRDYVYGEKTYALLSLVAKSLLAWQVFGGFLAS